MKSKIALMGIWVLFLSVAIVNAQEDKPKSGDANQPFDAIKKAVEDYAVAYNAHDAKAIANLFAPDAELVDTSGTVFQGQDVIRQEYEAFFNAHPDASLTINVESVRMVGPSVAVEEGRTASVLAEGETPSLSRYVAVYSKIDDAWVLASVRDEKLEPEPGQHLEQLNWLIGQWIEESDDSRMEIDCYWDESGSYLIRDFKISIEGLLASSGTERIGWDPLNRQIRSWLFDSSGGHIEATWIPSDGFWTATARGYRADGQAISAIYRMTPLRDDAYHMAATNRRAGDEGLGDFEMTIVRQPPAPGEVPPLDESPAESAPAESNKE